MLIFLLALSHGIYFELKGAKVERCFKINLDKNHQISGGYSISGGSKNSYMARILDPNRKIIHVSDSDQ